MTCTCFQWQSTGIPCSHAINVILTRQEDPQTYVQAFLSLDAYHQTDVNAIFPPNIDVVDKPLQYGQNDGQAHSDDENSVRDRVIALHANCQPGRPKKCRIRSGVEGPFGPKRPKKCGRCDKLGHAQNNCNALIAGF